MRRNEKAVILFVCKGGTGINGKNKRQRDGSEASFSFLLLAFDIKGSVKISQPSFYREYSQ
jgi:hypothetical protein